MSSCSATAWGSWQPTWWQETLIILGIVGATLLLAIVLAVVTVLITRKLDVPFM